MERAWTHRGVRINGRIAQTIRVSGNRQSASGNRRIPKKVKTEKSLSNYIRLGLIRLSGDSFLSALDTDELIRDVSPPDPGTWEVDPRQAMAAFYHGSTSKRFATITSHSIVAIISSLIIVNWNKQTVTLPPLRGLLQIHNTCITVWQCLSVLTTVRRWCFWFGAFWTSTSNGAVCFGS